MNILAIAPIEYLKLEGFVKEVDCLGFTITSGEGLLKALIEKYGISIQINSLLQSIGVSGYRYINQNNVALCLINTDELPSGKTPSSLSDISEHLHGIFYSVIHNLWFVKDNNVIIRKVYLCDLDANHWEEYSISTSAKNAEGLSIGVPFTEEEFRKLLFDYYSKISKYQLLDDNYKGLIKTGNIPHVEIPSTANYIPYNTNRIKRAMHFLEVVRNSASLLIKISFSMALLECLFTSEGDDITITVKTRASLFIGGNRKQKKSNQYYISTAYNIRSRFLHGENIKEMPEELVKISTKVDNLLRTILIKIINMEDDSIFTITENQQGVDLKKYFDDLLRTA